MKLILGQDTSGGQRYEYRMYRTDRDRWGVVRIVRSAGSVSWGKRRYFNTKDGADGYVTRCKQEDRDRLAKQIEPGERLQLTIHTADCTVVGITDSLGQDWRGGSS